ncbi:hypothetical protein SS50377_27704 [Spironucleus salmonicida]|uniref:Uncharacterized protein n=1 Tax=Spironucleus salmonicida TaxID=348837 RepID=V6LPI5_9EUKA|nr:hypothetical protein SS50377_27704 [Spironucleus salmonicida]|eukprot:EST46520.1 Hypothetical protein SS50377_13325 [Spironucleus salmonicida]
MDFDQNQINQLIHRNSIDTQSLIHKVSHQDQQLRLLESENLKLYDDLKKSRETILNNDTLIFDLSQQLQQYVKTIAFKENEIKDQQKAINKYQTNVQFLKQKITDLEILSQSQLLEYQSAQEKQTEILQKQLYRLVKDNKTRNSKKDQIIKELITEQKQLLSQMEYLNSKISEKQEISVNLQSIQNKLDQKDTTVKQQYENIQEYSLQIENLKNEITHKNQQIEQFNDLFSDIKNQIIIFKLSKANDIESNIQQLKIKLVNANTQIQHVKLEFQARNNQYRRKYLQQKLLAKEQLKQISIFQNSVVHQSMRRDTLDSTDL